jgi:hypothetical protein
MIKKLILAAVAASFLSGCVAVLAGTAGGLIVDEGLIENDGTFDPLENTEVGRQIYN